MKRLALVAGGALAALAYWWPAFADPGATGFGDWQMVHHNWEVGRVAIARHHEWPLFDPYHCGGVSVLGNPESQVYSPLFPLSFVVGTTLATKLFLALHTAVALLGAYAYARRVGRVRVPAALLAGVVFAGSGFFAWHGAGGHATFAPFAFLPLLHLLLREGERRAEPVVGLALLLALTVAEGGTYPYPYMLVSLGLAVPARGLGSPRDALRALRALLAGAGLSLGLAAFRLVPITRTLALIPRTIDGWDHGELPELLTFLTARDHPWRVPGHEFVWPEYATYVGFGVLALAALGALTSATRGRRALVLAHLAMAAVVAQLVLGDAGEASPWPLLRRLPVFDSLRVPSRFLVVLTFHLAVLAALGLDALARLGRGRAARLTSALAAGILLAITVDLGVVTRSIVDRWDRPPLDLRAPEPRRVYRNVDYDATYASLPARNGATTACYVGGMNWPVSRALRLGDVPFAWTTDPDARVELLRQTSSSHRLRYDAPRPIRVRLNQNHDPAFRASVGRVVEDEGLLALDLPAGRGEVELHYDARDGRLGLAATLATLGGLAAGLTAIRRRRKRRALGSPRVHA